MIVPSDQVLRQLARRHGLRITDDKEALDNAVKQKAAAQRKQRRQLEHRKWRKTQTFRTDEDYARIFRILSNNYTITAEEFAEATRKKLHIADLFLKRLKFEGVLEVVYKENRTIYYSLRNPQ